MLEPLHIMDTFEYEIGPYIYLENEYDMDE